MRLKFVISNTPTSWPLRAVTCKNRVTDFANPSFLRVTVLLRTVTLQLWASSGGLQCLQTFFVHVYYQLLCISNISGTSLGECFEKLIVLSTHNLLLGLVVPWICVCTGVAWVMLHIFYVSALGSWVSSFTLRLLRRESPVSSDRT
jgi:hypothetical protein